MEENNVPIKNLRVERNERPYRMAPLPWALRGEIHGRDQILTTFQTKREAEAYRAKKIKETRS